MSEDHLAENLIYYRKKKGLSQEKLSEYMNVSRQAVTKWESNSSRPNSENLTKLAQLFGIDVETLLGNEETEKSSIQEDASIGKMSWIFIGISALCILLYIIHSSLTGIFSVGTLICMFVLCVPIQLFLHIYFSNAINNNDFSGIAGFDDKIKYNDCEVKKLLIRIELHMEMISAVTLFLLCVMNISDLKMGRFHDLANGILLVLYILNVIMDIVMNNYKTIDKIYCDEDDKKRAKRSIPITIIYIFLLCVGMVITGIVFTVKGIESNTLPAIKICGLLLVGIISTTTVFLLESGKIKKWNPQNTDYKMNKTSLIGLFICFMMYALICVV